MKETTCECHKTAAFLLLRFFLGILFIIAFVGKLKGEANDYAWNNLIVFSQKTTENFAQNTFLPQVLLIPFCYTLPWVELILGLAIFFGIKTRLALIGFGFIMLNLCLGMMLMKQSDAVANNSFYLFLASVALYLSSHNRFCLMKD
jgi:uncharacterized membrane protein YphA (DoxX/SURF4 family)